MSDSEFYSREYNNRVLFPDHPAVMARWADKSARTRSSMICYLDRQYGDSPGETLDIFPARKGDGTCMMFIHGGFWRAMDKQDFSFLAPAWVDAGVSIVAVNYDLCPKVSVEEIVRQMLRASGWLWKHAEDYGMDQDRLYVAGHSAGGHLAAMMMAARWPVYDKELPRDFRSSPYRSTDGTIYSVAEGSGTVRIGTESFGFEPRDTFVVPSWQPVRFETADEAVLFSYSDRPAQAALGLLREHRG